MLYSQLVDKATWDSSMRQIPPEVHLHRADLIAANADHLRVPPPMTIRGCQFIRDEHEFIVSHETRDL